MKHTETIIIAGGWRLHASVQPTPHSDTTHLQLRTSYDDSRAPHHQRTLLDVHLKDAERHSLIALLQKPDQTA